MTEFTAGPVKARHYDEGYPAHIRFEITKGNGQTTEFLLTHSEIADLEYVATRMRSSLRDSKFLKDKQGEI